jgi:hypothetical protein
MKGLSLTLALLMTLVAVVAGCSSQPETQPPASQQAMMEPPVEAPAPVAPAPAPQPHATGAPAPRPAPRTVPEETRAPVRPPQPAEPETVTITIPAGTSLALVFDTPLTSATAHAGDEVTARLKAAITVGDRVAFPADSEVRGTVADVKPATKGYKDTGGAISVAFTKIVAPGGRSAAISAGFTKIAEGSAGKKAAIIGGSAVGGALLGSALDKDEKGAALIGGAIGAAVAGATKGKEAVINSGEEIPVTLEKSARTSLKR